AVEHVYGDLEADPGHHGDVAADRVAGQRAAGRDGAHEVTDHLPGEAAHVVQRRGHRFARDGQAGRRPVGPPSIFHGHRRLLADPKLLCGWFTVTIRCRARGRSPGYVTGPSAPAPRL